MLSEEDIVWGCKKQEGPFAWIYEEKGKESVFMIDTGPPDSWSVDESEHEIELTPSKAIELGMKLLEWGQRERAKEEEKVRTLYILTGDDAKRWEVERCEEADAWQDVEIGMAISALLVDGQQVEVVASESTRRQKEIRKALLDAGWMPSDKDGGHFAGWYCGYRWALEVRQ